MLVTEPIDDAMNCASAGNQLIGQGR